MRNQRDGHVLGCKAPLGFACDCGRSIPDPRDARIAELEQERDAYKRAKEENDERFMCERDEARAERDNCRMNFNALQAAHRERHEELARLREALEWIADGCLVPPDGGSPRLEDAVDAAREALKGKP